MLTISIVCLGLLALWWVAWVVFRPMTVCLTFDDGFKLHAVSAGPMLRVHGWYGAFNVPTAIIGGTQLTDEQMEDLCLKGHEGERMSWDDVRDLLKAGHEVYPHTCDHVDLTALERANQMDEIARQISLSKATMIEQTGVVPRFFCLPHNRSSVGIARAIRRHGMEPLACYRPNFGQDAEGASRRDVTKYLLGSYWSGLRHVDCMIHGIERKKGGWMPFEDIADFNRFLNEIAALEQCGKIRVVPYSRAHSFRFLGNPLVRRYQWLALKFRRACFKLIACRSRSQACLTKLP